ncbi:thiamine-phosphate kinase [Veillonella caviae]|uniref:thiamine-phosphate kinase n=1 Tax=Veillonella caviae TaxID=248316 RepID=UPI0023F18D3D|nr:thiamine-phosphate kinase [Veillonella caviae]MCI6407585.1 thiamine-phosphate kinase [Veillonella caviae]
MNVSDTGEFGFIDAIKLNTLSDETTVVKGIGDDCAVYRATPEYDQLITTDMMVRGIHFSEQTTAPFDVGYRLGTANISDIAAMGGIPRQAVVAVAMPVDTDLGYMSALFDGLKEVCHAYKVNLIGGDTVTTTGPLTLSVTLVGEVPKGEAVLRSGAQPGDLVVVSNTIGNSAAGLALLLAQIKGFNFCKRAHQRPEPQIKLGQWLRQQGATALNDISDGLSSELWDIAQVSQVAIIIDEARVPLHEETYKLAASLQTNPVDYALYGGEDFQLVFTAPKSLESSLQDLDGITIIGEVIEGTPSVQAITKDKTIRTLDGKGYNHFHE